MLNTGLNFEVILPITCILTSQQLHQSFELESNSSLTRTVLLSTERKKRSLKISFILVISCSQGSLLAIPPSLSFCMDGWGRTLGKRFIQFFHFLCTGGTINNLSYYKVLKLKLSVVQCKMHQVQL